MNFLAHCALANEAANTWTTSDEGRTGLLAGAVVGDFTKGPIASEWPTPLRAGVRLHRKIDALSNVHPAIARTCDRFPPEQRRFAPIFVDILADHCLTLHWTKLHAQPLGDFSSECYRAIHEYRSYLGQRGERFFDYMRDEDLLARYDEWRHVEVALQSVLRRLDKRDEFDGINAAMHAIVESGSADFLDYYPALSAEMESWNAFDAIAAPRTE